MISRVTASEEAVAELLVQGFSNEEIAVSLSVSQGTVKNRLAALRRKTGTDNRVDLAVFWVMEMTDVTRDRAGLMMVLRRVS